MTCLVTCNSFDSSSDTQGRGRAPTKVTGPGFAVAEGRGAELVGAPREQRYRDGGITQRGDDASQVSPVQRAIVLGPALHHGIGPLGGLFDVTK